MSDYEDEEISEGAEYSPKSEFSKPKLVEDTVRKCCEARSSEMKEGYFNYKLNPQGVAVAKMWIPDSRKVFDSNILALRNLLSPEIKNNKNFQTKEKSINDKKKEVFKKYCYTIKEQKLDGNKIVWKDTNQKIIPEKDCLIVCKNIRMNDLAKEVKGIWNSKVNYYWNELTILNDELFAALNELIDSLNYFKQRVSY